MRIAIHALATNTGGATTYFSHLLQPLVAALRPMLSAPLQILWGQAGTMPGEAPELLWHDFSEVAATPATRWFFDQVELPRWLATHRIDVLFCAGGLGPLHTDVPIVTLSRNWLFFWDDYVQSLPFSAFRALWIRRMLHLRLLESSACVLFPTRALHDVVVPHLKSPPQQARIAPYGVELEQFARPSSVTVLAEATEAYALESVSLLWVSHACEQKNLLTLLRACEILESRCPGYYTLTLVGTLRALVPAEHPAFPSLGAVLHLVDVLEAKGVVHVVGAMPHGSLRDVFQAADVFVFPSWIESFAHPLVEAMASGLPVICADTPTHREVCANAAHYVEPASPVAWADEIQAICAATSEAMSEHRTRSLARASLFSWDAHAAIVAKSLHEAGGGR